jgi:hypothetical protein
MTDVYTSYETGLRALLERLGRDHPRYEEALTYQQRLTDNVQSTRRYGDTEARRAERAEIVDRLNALALETLDASYSALCQSEEKAQGTAPPLGEATPTPHVDTSGGAYVAGDVHVCGGDFVGRGQAKSEAQHPAPTARNTVPAQGEPLALIAAALQARRLLLVWASVPFPVEERPTDPAALLINRWRRDAQALPPFPWPVPQLPPLSTLSLDPSDRIEAAFREASVRLNVLHTRQDVVDPGQHNLLKLGGDLGSRSGLLLTWAKVRDVPNDADKVHLLEEARDVAEDGVVLVVTDDPRGPFVQLWDELVRAYVSGARHCFALGPADAHWPEGVKHLSVDVNGVLTRLTDIEVPSPTPSTSEAPPPVRKVQGIHEKLDRLLQGQEGLKQGQGAIYRHVGTTQRQAVAQVLAGLQEARLDDAQVRRELHGTLDAVRRALIHMQAQQLPALDAEVKRALDEVTEIVCAGVDLRTGLELTVPLIPLLLSYRTTLEAGTGLDLRQVWRNLIDWARSKSEGSTDG